MAPHAGLTGNCFTPNSSGALDQIGRMLMQVGAAEPVTGGYHAGRTKWKALRPPERKRAIDLLKY